MTNTIVTLDDLPDFTAIDDPIEGQVTAREPASASQQASTHPALGVGLASEEDSEDAPFVAPFDPSTLGFPMMLPVELALAEQRPSVICEAWGISKEQFARIIKNPVFEKAYNEARELLKKEGMSYRTKARMQSELLLKTSWKIIHDPFTPSNVKADLIKWTAKVAGLEPKESSGVLNGTNLQINILLK